MQLDKVGLNLSTNILLGIVMYNKIRYKLFVDYVLYNVNMQSNQLPDLRCQTNVNVKVQYLLLRVEQKYKVA